MDSRAHRLSSCGTLASVVAAPSLSCPTACGILVSQPRIKPTSPALEGRVLTTGPPEILSFAFFEVLEIFSHWASLMAQLVNTLPAMQENPVRFLGCKDPLEKG